MKLRNLTGWILALVVLSSLSAAQAAERRPATQPAPQPLAARTSEFGGVYFPGEAITLKVTAIANPLPASLAITVTDADRKSIATMDVQPAWLSDEAGVGAANISLFPAGKAPGLGYYTAQIASGDLKTSVAFIVVPPPTDAVDAEKSAMGMVVSPISRTPTELADYLHAGRRMGMRWISIDVPVSVYAPDANTLSFETGSGRRLNLDQVVAAAVKENLLVNQKIFGVPAWLASDASEKSKSPWYEDCYTSPIKDKAGYVKVISAMAARYKGRIRSYEFGNSPYREPGYYCGANEDFIRDLTWTREAVKAGDPTALVCAAGFVQKTDLVPELLKKAPDAIDVLTIHYFTADAGEGVAPQWYYVAPPSFYEAAFKEAGLRKPMWDTSAIGVPQDDLNTKRGASVAMNKTGVSEEGIIRSLARNLSHGVSRTMFSALNIGGRHMDLFMPDGQPRTSVCEYAIAARELDGSEFLQAVQADSPLLEGYYFQRGEDVFAVVWCNVNGAGGQLGLPAKGDSCTVVDRFGRESKLSASGGKVSLPVGFRPLFVHGLTAPTSN